MTQDDNWLNKRHWMVAVWPVNEDNSLKAHEPWRMAIIHADTKEELEQNLFAQLIPFSSPFRIWIVEMTEENSYIGTYEVTSNLRWKKGKSNEQTNSNT